MRSAARTITFLIAVSLAVAKLAALSAGIIAVASLASLICPLIRATLLVGVASFVSALSFLHFRGRRAPELTDAQRTEKLGTGSPGRPQIGRRMKDPWMLILILDSPPWLWWSFKV